MIHKTMIRFQPVYTPKGQLRHVAVSLPLISCLVDEKAYQPPPPIVKSDAAERMTARRIRQALGRDPEKPMKREDATAYAATMARIRREGF